MKNTQFEWNARTQITMWFDNAEEEASLLRDYGTSKHPSTREPMIDRLIEPYSSKKLLIVFNLSPSFFVSCFRKQVLERAAARLLRPSSCCLLQISDTKFGERRRFPAQSMAEGMDQTN